MTTQSAERILRTVQATVAGHEIYNGKPTIKLTIPAWGSQYPTVLYNATPEQQILLPMGATLNVILEQNRLREGKDPTKMFNYFWSFIGISDGPPDPGISAATGVSQVSRERSIQRQVALKAAVKVRGFEDDPQNIIQTAQAFFDWLSEEGQGQTAPPSNGTAAQHPAQPNPRPPAETGNPPAPPNSRPPAKTGNPPAAAAPPTSPAAPIPPDPVHASLQNPAPGVIQAAGP